MIYTIGGIKGGSGKTTVATHLAVLLATDESDVLLVDADDQETATDFTTWRNERMQGEAGYTAIRLSGNAVRTEVLRLRDKYEDIVIDTGGRDTTSQRAAIAVADVYLVPFIPRSFDVWTLERVEALVGEMRPANPELIALAFLNRADPRGHDNADASELLKSCEELAYLDLPLGNRKAFANASSQGMAVTEYRPRDTKAMDEITRLYQRLKGIKSTLK